MITHAGLLDNIKRLVLHHGSKKAAAKALGVSPQYLCDVLVGRREPGYKILSALGYRRVVMYDQALESPGYPCKCAIAECAKTAD